MLRDGGRHGNFRSAGFKRALGFLSRPVPRGARAHAHQHADLQRLGRVRPRLFQLLHLRPVEYRRVQAAAAARPPDDLDDGAAARARRRRASIAGGSSLVIFARSANARTRPGSWSNISRGPAVQMRFHELTGDLPPRRSGWDAPALAGDRYARAFRDQLERAEPPPKVPEWERIAQRDAARRRAGGARDERRRGRPRELDAAPTAFSKSAAGCWSREAAR